MTTIADPHPNAYVTVVDGLAHRPGSSRSDGRPNAACNPRATGSSLSYGWARHTQAASPCRQHGCWPSAFAAPTSEETDGDRWWMGARRHNSQYHRLPPGDTAKTPCGKYAGLNAGVLDNGQFVTPQLVTSLNAKPCKQCWPT